MLTRILGSIYGRMQSSHYAQRYRYYYTRYSLSKGFKFVGTDIRIYGEGKLVVGENSYIGSYSTIQLAEGCVVSIGNDCAISHNVRFYSSSLKADSLLLSGVPHTTYSGDVTVGNGVLIGANCFINPGIHIGDHAVIGANTVVTSHVPAYGIYAGCPGRLIRFKNVPGSPGMTREASGG